MSVLFELPLSGDVQVYGDFSSSHIPVEISYTASGGHLPGFDLADQSTFAEYVINIHVNTALIIQNVCNANGAFYHCSRADQFLPDTFMTEISGLNITSHVSYILGSGFIDTPPDAMLVSLHVFATLPDGFSLAPPVPEPATWLLMMLGFAIIGLTVIRRKGYSAGPDAPARK